MFKLSKESKITFTGLLLVPLVWIVLNHFGFLDFIEYKSVDLRLKVRGNLSHQEGPLSDERVTVEGNKTVPRIPKVMYVNFDASTLSMDEVGERPWNRSFFKDVGKILLEEGNARVVGYDFIFSPKSTSSMVPERNVYISDSAIADLVGEFPDQVVLGSAFSNVQTPFLKNDTLKINFLSGPPNLYEGYDAKKMGFRYPESPTYPIFDYRAEKYLGINAPITVAPNDIDGMQRVASLWFPGGGKAHAYNVLGGKMAKLSLEDVESNESSGATLVEIGEELHLVWEDSNNTLVDTLPNKMPLVRDRNFYHFGMEALIAYYGVGEQSVEIDEGNKNIVIRSLAGEPLVEVPLIEKQGMEINWFSNWKDEAEAEKLWKEAKEFPNQKNFAEYAAKGPEIIRLYLQRIEGLELPSSDSDLVGTLKDLEFDEKMLKTAEQMIKAAAGRVAPEKAPDVVEFEKLLTKIADNYIPPDLFSEYNPMCGMDDILNYKRYLADRQSEIKNIDEKIIPLTKLNLNKIRAMLYKRVEDQELFGIWTKLVALEERITNLEKSFVESGKNDFIGDQLNKSRLEYSRGLEDIERFEISYFDNDANYTAQNVVKDADLAQERFLALGKGLNESDEKIGKMDEEIANLRESVEKNPSVEYLRTKLDQQVRNRSTMVSNFVRQGFICLDVLKGLITYNQKKRSDTLREVQMYEGFFEQFQDAIVLVGPTEATFQDLSPTPMDKNPVPKVSLHGNVIKTLASGIYLTRILEGKLSGSFLILAVCLILGYLAVNSGPWSNWVGVIFILLFVAVALFLFAQHHVVMPLAAPSLAGVSTFFIGLIVMMVVEQKAKGRLKGMFGSYVSAELVDQMVESGEEPHLGGEETAITAFFSDVQAFSSFSELLTPTGLVDLMNEYLTAMTDILQEERGTLDKYIGDAIVAMYGAPIPMKDHAYQSVRTALRMQEKQLELRDKWALEEEKWGKCYGLVKQMQTRIGCNTGTATVGNMGALDRFNYTMMGDMVNLAARCESGAKAYGAYIMITEETKLAAEKLKDDIAYRYLDKIVVKGRSQPVSMYEPTGFMADLGQETQDCLDCFRQGIDKYLAQDWEGALKMFEKAKEMEPNKPGVTPGVKDNPSMILIDRCQIMKENPPGDDWDGVYVMTSK
jgi:class 3 adenylate cyclase/CHASE2 domain-containing sensor protein